MKDQVYRIISLLATFAYFIPVLIMLVKKLWKDPCFLLLGLYWLVNALINIVASTPGITQSQLETITIIYNMIDIPFILGILWYTTASSLQARMVKFIIPAYVLTEIVLVFKLGLQYDSIKYVMGVGLVIVMIALVWEISLYLQQVQHSNRERSMLFIYAALLFEYGSYTIVYIFDYFIITAETIDKLLIYYSSTLISVAIACFGFMMRKTNRESLVFK